MPALDDGMARRQVVAEGETYRLFAIDAILSASPHRHFGAPPELPMSAARH